MNNGESTRSVSTVTVPQTIPEVIDYCWKVAEDRRAYAREWKARTGQPVVGYLCTYSPEEVLYAAGVLPVRILGSRKQHDETQCYIYSMFCPYCQDTFASGLRGEYDYLDGIIHTFCCIHIRQTYDSWVRHLHPGFSQYLYMPNHLSAAGVRDQCHREMKKHRQAVEEWLGISITNEALEQALDIYDCNRRLLRQIYEHRKADPPPLNGVEAMLLVQSAQLMDKAEHNELLRVVVDQLPRRSVGESRGPRLMYMSSECDDFGLIKFIEDLGAEVVIDENCVGTRYFWNESQIGNDPLRRISDWYIDKPLCPVKNMMLEDMEEKRLPFLRGLIEEYGVQGAIYGKMRFCDPHEYDIPHIESMLKEMGIPMLNLEIDIINPPGQFRTRIEAFLETLGMKGLEDLEDLF